MHENTVGSLDRMNAAEAWKKGGERKTMSRTEETECKKNYPALFFVTACKRDYF